MKNTKNSIDINMKKEALQHQLKTLEIYEQLRKKLEDEINWNWMVYHEADEEHNNEAWFTMPDEDCWKYDEAKVALEILEKFDNATLK